MARFKYLNVNPNGDITDDCVTRAITLGTGIPYKKVAEKLRLVAQLFECDKLCIGCYSHLLDNVFKFKKVDADGMYPAEFADLHPYGIYLLRMNGHIITIIDGVIYDIFDSRYYDFITDAWKIE